MECTREGEQDADQSRTSRFYETDDGWYLRTREGISVGPYFRKFDAQLAASLLSPVLDQVESPTDTITAIHRFSQDPGYGPAPCKRPVEAVPERTPLRNSVTQAPRSSATPKSLPKARRRGEDGYVTVWRRLANSVSARGFS